MMMCKKFDFSFQSNLNNSKIFILVFEFLDESIVHQDNL